MSALQMLIDLHIDGDRQGPGGDDATALAVTLSGLADAEKLQIADIGCGTGAVSLYLAQALDAHITAVDILQPFLDRLEQRANQAGLADRIDTLASSMDALPFDAASFDAIWSEGAIYNMGFEKGVQYLRQFLKPGGVLAVSEVIWTSLDRADEIEQFWNNGYSEIDLASAKIAALEGHGYQPIGYFPLTRAHWMTNYYRPMQHRFDKLLAKYRQTAESVAKVMEAREEIALYEKYADQYSYGYFVARKT